jgi:hypothetical protein
MPRAILEEEFGVPPYLRQAVDAGEFQCVHAAPTLTAKTYPFGLQRAELSKGTWPKGRSIWHINSVTLDWMNLAVILSTFFSCAVAGWFATCLVRRFVTVNANGARCAFRRCSANRANCSESRVEALEDESPD